MMLLMVSLPYVSGFRFLSVGKLNTLPAQRFIIRHRRTTVLVQLKVSLKVLSNKNRIIWYVFARDGPLRVILTRGVLLAISSQGYVVSALICFVLSCDYPISCSSIHYSVKQKAYDTLKCMDSTGTSRQCMLFHVACVILIRLVGEMILLFCLPSQFYFCLFILFEIVRSRASLFDEFVLIKCYHLFNIWLNIYCLRRYL